MASGFDGEGFPDPPTGYVRSEEYPDFVTDTAYALFPGGTSTIWSIPLASVVSLILIAGIAEEFTTFTEAPGMGWPLASKTFTKSAPFVLLFSRFFGAIFVERTIGTKPLHVEQSTVTSTRRLSAGDVSFVVDPI